MVSGRHDIVEILLKVALSTKNQSKSNLKTACFIMVNVLASSVVDRGFGPRMDQTKDLYWYLLLLR